MFAYLLLDVLDWTQLQNVPKRGPWQRNSSMAFNPRVLELQTEATLPDLLTALMPPYLRALLGTRQERALLIERASITIKTFINECNVKEMIIFLRLIKRTMLNWRGICQKKKKCQGTDARKQTQFRANSASNQMVFQNLWYSIWSQSVGVLWSALHFPFSRTNFQ